MITAINTPRREKLNFMVNKDISVELKKWIPAGERSDFVNGALQDAIVTYKRQRAAEMMDEFREKANIKISTKELIQLKNYGRP